MFNLDTYHVSYAVRNRVILYIIKALHFIGEKNAEVINSMNFIQSRLWKRRITFNQQQEKKGGKKRKNALSCKSNRSTTEKTRCLEIEISEKYGSSVGERGHKYHFAE